MGNKKIASLVALAITAVAVLMGILAYRTRPPAQGEGPEDLRVQESRSAEPIVTPPAGTDAATSPVEETPTYTSAEFEVFTQKFREELPPMQVLRAQPKHALHPGLIAAYTRSGQMARAAIRQPELREAAYAALESCANLAGYDLSVRAMCLRQHRRIRRAAGDTVFDERNRIRGLRELDNLIRRSFGDDE
ncbi:MAG TPA: hypothetical protein VM901_04885 [Bdellovibrionota bacterium]|jgi:hypothetical protein|nr:hypothetical protein [Bdellovibrionota bacterium]